MQLLWFRYYPFLSYWQSLEVLCLYGQTSCGSRSTTPRKKSFHLFPLFDYCTLFIQATTTCYLKTIYSYSNVVSKELVQVAVLSRECQSDRASMAELLLLAVNNPSYPSQSLRGCDNSPLFSELMHVFDHLSTFGAKFEVRSSEAEK